MNTASAQPPVSRPVIWLLWLALPLATHLAFSWIGFNPTDDGWLSAVAFRLLHAEVPHRDFIFPRPALSALLNVPLVHWGGERILWWSRLAGWLTIAIIAGGWTFLATRAAAPNRAAAAGFGRYTPGIEFALYASALALTAHTFPVMAWHSLDGMLLCTLATGLLLRATPAADRLAFVCVGLAALCRQNFAFFVPVLMLAAPRTVRGLHFFWAALPPLTYLALIAAAGGAGDCLRQLSSPGSWLVDSAFVRYVRHPVFLGALVGGVTFSLLLRRARGSPVLERFRLPALALVSASLIASLWRGGTFYRHGAFLLFGVTAGVVIAKLWQGTTKETRTISIAGLGLAWCAAISYGYNSPALGAGVLLAVLWRALMEETLSSREKIFSGWLIAATALGLAVALVHARRQFPSRDRPAPELRFDVGAVIAGGTGIKTNAVTYAVLEDLGALRRRFDRPGQPSAILTDFSAAWLDGARNPLPVEWAQSTELADNPALIRRVTDALASLPPEARIIAQRIRVADLGQGLLPLPVDDPYYAVQNWLRRHGTKLTETHFFEVYAPPARP